MTIQTHVPHVKQANTSPPLYFGIYVILERPLVIKKYIPYSSIFPETANLEQRTRHNDKAMPQVANHYVCIY